MLALKERGVEIRTGDIATDTVETLTVALRGAEVVIAAVAATLIDKQWNVIKAAKAAGVKRCVASNFLLQ